MHTRINQPERVAVLPGIRSFTAFLSRNFRSRWAFVLLASLVAASQAPARSDTPALFSFQVDPAVLRPGETATLWVDVELLPNWHIYSTTTPPGGPLPTEIRIESGDRFRQIGPVIQPKPVRDYDPNFEMNVEYFGESVKFGLRAEVVPGVPQGEAALKGSITYMLCDPSTCLPPTTLPFKVPLHIVAGPPREIYVTTIAPAAPGVEQLDGVGSILDVERAVSRGLLPFLSLAFSMGLIALLTPCVFPMIPITVSFFTKQANTDRAESVLKSLVYCLGIVFTFTGLGLLLAATLGASGANRFAANPFVNLLIAGLFVAFALNLFGLFEIRLPTGLVNRFGSVGGGGYWTILAMGFAFTLTSFTCTAPFVGTLLVLTSQGSWTWPLLGMLAFSAAFALPFFFLSLFPQGLASLPKSGGWLNSVKVVMGFLELAAAMKFLSNVDLVWKWGVLSREVFLATWIAIFAICAIYLLGKVRLPHDSPLESVGPVRLITSLGCLAFSLYLLSGLQGSPLGEFDAFLPPYGSQGSISNMRGGEDLSWEDNYEEALATARRDGRPIFIDFTGYACTNCRWMEANIFSEPDVRSMLGRFVLVQLYTDGVGDVYARNRDFQEVRFGTVALPFYAVLSPTDREIARFPGLTRDKALFLRFLQMGLAESAQAKLPQSLSKGI